MAFNVQSSFNKLPFNVEATEAVISIAPVLTERVTATAGTASIISLYYTTLNERVTAVSDGNLTYMVTPVLSEAVSAEVSNVLGSITLFPSEYVETVQPDVELSADIKLDRLLAETIDSSSKILVAFNVHSIMDTVVSQKSAGHQAKIKLYDLSVAEEVNASAELISLDTKVCRIGTGSGATRLTLKPGEVLIIDANTYNVLYNGNNAIWLQSGDWIDELDRETTDIKITAASGAANLSASIVYTERYL